MDAFLTQREQLMQIYMNFHSAEDEQRTGLGLYVHDVHYKKQSQDDFSDSN